MLICTRNVLAEHTVTVTHGGLAAGAAINDPSVLRNPYVGDPFITTRRSGSFTGATLRFDLGSAKPIRALGFLADIVPGDQVRALLYIGGIGGTLLNTVTLTGPTYGYSNFMPVCHLDLFASTPGDASVSADTVVFDWTRAASDPPTQVLRCYAGNGIKLTNYSDTLALRDSSTGERSMTGAWFGVERARRRELSVSITDQPISGTFAPLTTSADDSFAELVARVGAIPEVLVIHPQPKFCLHGRFVSPSRIDRQAGPLNDVQLTIREF